MVSVPSFSAHTPDNSFLGFVVGNNKKNTTAFKKKDIGVVYGKEMYMWQVRTCMHAVTSAVGGRWQFDL